MMEEAWIRDITLTREPNGSIKFDLNPNLGLDILLSPSSPMTATRCDSEQKIIHSFCGEPCG
jgi:hypothetical protein